MPGLLATAHTLSNRPADPASFGKKFWISRKQAETRKLYFLPPPSTRANGQGTPKTTRQKLPPRGRNCLVRFYPVTVRNRPVDAWQVSYIRHSFPEWGRSEPPFPQKHAEMPQDVSEMPHLDAEMAIIVPETPRWAAETATQCPEMRHIVSEMPDFLSR